MNESSKKALQALADAHCQIFLNNAIAVADAVLEDAKKRSLHAPTVEYYRGQKLIAEQILLILDGKELPDDGFLNAVIDKGKLKVYDEDGERIELVFGDDVD